MKSLTEYIREKQEEPEFETKTFSFNLKDYEGSKETLEALSSAAGENIDYSDNDGKISFTISKENFTEATAFITALKDYIKKLGTNTVKRSSDAAYADRVHKMEDKIKELDNLIASYSTEEKTEDPEEKQEEEECKDGKCDKDKE